MCRDRVAALRALVAGVVLWVPPPVALGQEAPPTPARPPRLSFESSLLATTRLPAPLVDDRGCGSSHRAGLGLAVGAGYRLRSGLRAEGRLGVFGQPRLANADCVTGPAAPTSSVASGDPAVSAAAVATPPSLPPAPGTVERTSDFDPLLADQRGFAQARLVADVGGRNARLRVSAGAGRLLGIRAPFASASLGLGERVRGVVVMWEVEQWWMRAPAFERTTEWQAVPPPSGAPAGAPVYARPVVTAERRFARAVRPTWLRLSATVPVPGT